SMGGTATEVLRRSAKEIRLRKQSSWPPSRTAAAIGILGILFQAILFGWHHHPLAFSARGVTVAVSAANSQFPAAADDDCEICAALAHHHAAPAIVGPSAPLPA